MNLKKKILYSVDAGLFLSGIILGLFSKLGTSEVGIRTIIGTTLIYGSYFLFPFIGMDKKEKIMTILGVHFLIIVICFISLYFSLGFYNSNPNGGAVWKEILATIGVLFIFSYIAYLFIAFVRTSFRIILKIKTYLFSSSVRENYSATKKIIEGITAFLVAVTAMAVSIASLISSINSLIH